MIPMCHECGDMNGECYCADRAFEQSTNPPPADELALAVALAHVAPDEWAMDALVRYFADMWHPGCRTPAPGAEE